MDRPRQGQRTQHLKLTQDNMKRDNTGNARNNDQLKKNRTTAPSFENKKCSLETFPHHYEKPFPSFKEPLEIGSFSINEQRQYQNDKSQLKIYSPPANSKTCHFDLRLGYSSMIKKDESFKTYLNDLLNWIVSNKQKVLNLHKKPNDVTGEKFERLNTDFVCWRGLLTRLLCVPYENREDLLLAVINYRGTYYMCEYDTEAKLLQKSNETHKQEEMCAWGFKFEQYITADKCSGVPDTKQPVNTNAEYGSIVCSRLGTNSLMFGAEVDCEDSTSKSNNNYIELKTSRIMDTQRQYENFCKYKLIKWWAQSFVLGIRRIVCGFRDDDGVVRKLEEFNVAQIPSIVQETLQHPWRPNVCFNFLMAFLDFVKASVADDDRNVYLFRWQPGSHMTVEKRKDDKTFNFLPDWFREWSEWDKATS